jgi:alpha-mannosidase
VRLTAGADWVELINTIDKKRAPLNPHPGQGGPGDEFAQRGDKESVQFAFPFAVADGQIRLDVPLAVVRPELDQLPGSCKNWLPVGRWIDVANDKVGVTWASLDAPLVEIGEVSATMLGSQKNPSVWRKHIEPTQKFYSWVMNNHWGTNYRAYQEGVVEFRYALRPHRGYDAAVASRLAIGLSQPLLVARAAADAPLRPLFTVEPDDVLALTLKPTDDQKGWILRLFGASGQDRRARIRWSSQTGNSPRIWLSDLREQPLQPAGEEIDVAAFDLVTLRIEHA